MAAMRMTPFDVHILDHFRRRAKTRVDIKELERHCGTYDCADLHESIDRLVAGGMMRRLADGTEWLVLTRSGRRYAGLAAVESNERIDRLNA
jgi:hypothetical protein